MKKIKLQLTKSEIDVICMAILPYYKNLLQMQMMWINDKNDTTILKKMVIKSFVSMFPRFLNYQHNEKKMCKTMLIYQDAVCIFICCKNYPSNPNDVFICNTIQNVINQIEPNL